ncbi:MAG: hypothetical protein IT428_18555 [Planctomycetaceae bacterium]|nr:hypothetical protein [Planctomycetaceae bacterium]
MAVAMEVSKALDLRHLALPTGGPRILRLEVEEYVDHSGDDALRVWAILPNDVDVEGLTGRWVVDFKGAIRDALRAQGISLFPYISIAPESEWREATSES